MPHPVIAEYDNLTKYEISALNAEVGVSDGHPRQHPTSGQHAVLQSMPRLLEEAETEPFGALEKRAQRAFLSAMGQHAAPVSAGRVLSAYSSSLAMDIVARTLASGFECVGLVHPTFDNIPDILKAWHVQLIPLEEERLFLGEIPVPLSELGAVFITTPNNPTGAYLPEVALRKIAEKCAEGGRLLVLDVCFRGFDRRFQYDAYALLDEVGVDFVLIEDTGKLWPTSELKLGFIGFSQGCPLALDDAMSDLLLSVSPLVLRLVGELAREAAQGGFEELHQLIATNRRVLTEALDATAAQVVDPDSRISVARVLLPPGVSASSSYEHLKAEGVHVLPCGPFHWASPDQGERFIRVALGRDKQLIEVAAARLKAHFEAG